MWAILGWIWLGCTVVMGVLLVGLCAAHEQHGRTSADQATYEQARNAP